MEPDRSLPTISSLSPSHRIIRIDEDFDLFHLVLKYFYTHTFCFVTTPDFKPSPDIPTTLDAEGIYAIAHNLNIKPLEEKALHFLKATCNIDNITARALGNFASEHKVLGDVYDSYFLKHFGLVRNSRTFEDVFSTTNDADSNRINKKFRQLMQKLPL